MKNKRLLTVDDLIKFCENQNFEHFSSAESGYQICVQLPATFQKEETNNNDVLIASVLAFHTSANLNGSSLTEEAAKKAMKNMAYKPVLANFCEIDGVRDFTSHDFEVDEDGNYIYYEKQVGCFTSDKPFIKDDETVEGRKNIFAKVAIPRGYTDAADIIERKGGTAVSVELGVNELSWDSSERILLLNDVDVLGLTLLGKDPDTGNDVKPGMHNAHLQIEDFSADNNSVVNKAQLIDEIVAEVFTRLDNKQAESAEDKTTGKEERVEMDNENVNVEFEETETEDAEVKVTEVEEVEVDATEEEETLVVEAEASKEKVTDEAAETPDEVVDEFADDNPTDDGPANDDSDDDTEDESSEEEDEHQSVSAIEDEDSTETRQNNSIEYSVTFAGQTRTSFATLNEQLEALCILVNDTYGDADNEWYSVDADADKKIVYMHGWNNHYRQSYKVKGDIFSLTGDRIRIYPVWCSEDEKKELERIKANYSAIESELNSYKAAELHSKREAILSAEDYSVMADFAEFNELKNHMDDYSVDDLTKEADLIYAKFMKSNYSTFAAKDKAKSGMVFMTSGTNEVEEKLPYGGLFKNFKNKK